ncbi:hypothetical protein [Dechloromonas sp. A34]|uniref:hypothetical protein n=1 Tax=Dechloromonas sp. A34 TaxID=447588 RepID=UPI0022492AAA|nr:hypothetical protein [Dechloromonas sp. A34]
MRVVRHVVRSLLLFAALAVSNFSFANIDNPLADGPRWACWYAPTTLSVQCLLIHAPTQGIELRATEVASRIDRRLPTLVRMIWGSPEQLAGTHISIPLMTTPYEMDFVGQLAKSVMCGAQKDCSIHFDANTDGFAPVRAAALESGSSESEILAEMNAQGLALALALAPSEVAASANNKKRKRGFVS